MAALDKYDAECGGKPTVEGALHAFIDSDLELFGEHFDPVALKPIDLLKRG